MQPGVPLKIRGATFTAAGGELFLISAEGNAILCLLCRMVSFNPNDVAQRYCAQCHLFLEDERYRREVLALTEGATK